MAVVVAEETITQLPINNRCLIRHTSRFVVAHTTAVVCRLTSQVAVIFKVLLLWVPEALP